MAWRERDASAVEPAELGGEDLHSSWETRRKALARDQDEKPERAGRDSAS